MSTNTYFDRLADELRTASERAARPVSAPAVVRRRRPAVRTALAVAGATALVATGTALATTPSWLPVLGRPDLDDTPASTASSPVPAPALDAIGVLRRPQTDADRGPTAQRLLAHLGREHVGARPDSFRLVTAADGYSALLVSDERLDRPDGGGTITREPLCLLVSGGGTCNDLDGALHGALMAELGTRVVGIVPDGVTTVRVAYEGGGSIDVPVRDNFFSSDAPAATALSANGTPRRTTPTWLDANGHVVGP